jgi:hypothetical protein
MEYKNKYLKYKNKYLHLKYTSKGGSVSILNQTDINTCSTYLTSINENTSLSLSQLKEINYLGNYLLTKPYNNLLKANYTPLDLKYAGFSSDNFSP